jgi:hypothetical protein
MIPVKRNETDGDLRRIYFHCVNAADLATPETGEAGGRPQISVNGAAFADTANTLVHMGSGRYYVELTQAEVDVKGRSVIEGRYQSANTAEAPGTTLVITEYPDEDLKASVELLEDEAFMGRWVLDPAAHTLTLYRRDGVTVLRVFDLTPASASVPGYTGRTPQ